MKETLSGPHGPRYGRPSDRFGPPTALFSEPLALLKYGIDHLESFTPDSTTLDSAFLLVTTSTGFYAEEKMREEALKPILETLLPGDIKWQNPTVGGTPIADGAWFEGMFVYMILELKNEQGLRGDPFLQGLVTYGEVITQEKVCPLLSPRLTFLPLNHFT